jgi:hypothetical protein
VFISLLAVVVGGFALILTLSVISGMRGPLLLLLKHSENASHDITPCCLFRGKKGKQQQRRLRVSAADNDEAVSHSNTIHWLMMS